MRRYNNVFMGLLFGLLLFFASFVVLWRNEENNAKNIAIASYVSKKAVQIEPTEIQDYNDNVLVALSGKATTDSVLKDENLRIKKTLVLQRTVKMYQWKEKSHEDSSGYRTYSYKKVWSTSKIDSGRFHDNNHNNPDFPIETKGFYADNAKLGAFDLDLEQIKKIVPEKVIYDLPQSTKYSVENGVYFSGKDIHSPEIGDIQISYSYAPSGTSISLIGKQVSNHIMPFNYKNKDNYIQYNGSLNKKEIIEKYKQDNFTLTMGFRFIGWLIMFIGLKLLISPAERIFGFIPLLGRIANGISFFIIMLISLSLSLITIAIAWLTYRPIMSIILIVISIVILKIIKDKQTT